MQSLKFRETQVNSPIYKGGNPISLLVSKYGLDPAEIYKLGSNENPLKTSPAVIEAVQSAAANVNRYPPSADDLSGALAAYIGRGTSAGQFVVGNGGCEVLDLIAKSFIEPGDEAIICRPTFPIYELTLRRLGANVIYADLDEDYSYNPERILAAVTDKTKLLYLTSPNNPTGSILTQAQQDAIMSQLPKHVLVVADEVYWQFNDAPERADSLNYVQDGANMVILHSFSKLFGLAGLRMGYAIAPEPIAEYLQRGQLPFHSNALSITAAMAAVADRDHIEETISMTMTERPKMISALKNMAGLNVFPSQGNFVLIKPENDSKQLEEALQKEGIIVRELSNFYMPGFLRVSVGLPHENQSFIDKMNLVLSK